MQNREQIKDIRLKLAKDRTLRRRSKRKKRLSRSWQGDLILSIILILFASFSAYPLIFTIANSFKPLDEIFIFPPRLFPRNFTFDNFNDLFNLLGNTRIPITRYLVNTLFISIVGVVGHILLAAMVAYPLAKHQFPGKS